MEKKLKLTPKNSRKVLMYSKLTGSDLPVELIELSKKDLVDFKNEKDFHFLSNEQKEYYQYLTDLDGKIFSFYSDFFKFFITSILYLKKENKLPIIIPINSNNSYKNISLILSDWFKDLKHILVTEKFKEKIEYADLIFILTDNVNGTGSSKVSVEAILRKINFEKTPKSLLFFIDDEIKINYNDFMYFSEKINFFKRNYSMFYNENILYFNIPNIIIGFNYNLIYDKKEFFSNIDPDEPFYEKINKILNLNETKNLNNFSSMNSYRINKIYYELLNFYFSMVQTKNKNLEFLFSKKYRKDFFEYYGFDENIPLFLHLNRISTHLL